MLVTIRAIENSAGYYLQVNGRVEASCHGIVKVPVSDFILASCNTGGGVEISLYREWCSIEDEEDIELEPIPINGNKVEFLPWGVYKSFNI